MVTPQADTVDMTVTFLSSHRRLELKSDPRENNSHPLCTAHFAPVLCRFPRLHGSGAGIPGIGILIYSWYCGIGISSGDGIYSRSRDAETQMIEMRQQSSSTAMNAAVSGPAEAVRTMGQSVSKPRPEDMRVGKPEPYALGKDFDDWDFTFNEYAGTLDPAYPVLLKTARQSTITNSGD